VKNSGVLEGSGDVAEKALGGDFHEVNDLLLVKFIIWEKYQIEPISVNLIFKINFSTIYLSYNISLNY
jgi:hypothetical protein